MIVVKVLHCLPRHSRLLVDFPHQQIIDSDAALDLFAEFVHRHLRLLQAPAELVPITLVIVADDLVDTFLDDIGRQLVAI